LEFSVVRWASGPVDTSARIESGIIESPPVEFATVREREGITSVRRVTAMLPSIALS
jgi:hypothetical protein